MSVDDPSRADDRADAGAEPEPGVERLAGQAPGEEAEPLRRRLLRAMQRGDESPRLVRVARLARELLPGDSEYGDPLSTAGDELPHALGRRISALSAERPTALGEVGLGALQVWQSLSEAQGRGRGKEELAILFTDLVDFSRWALDAGDTLAVELLREVGGAVEPAVRNHGGRVVKRLGDGLMAVFAEVPEAVDAALEARERTGDVEVDGHRPELRAGIHVGRPRKLGGDYLGVDVNIAARVAAAASGGEILVSGPACEALGEASLKLRRRRRFKVKGAPKDLEVFSVAPRN